MSNSIKITFDNEKHYPARYSGRDTQLSDATIYFKERKKYIKSEMVNLDFVNAQANENDELVRPFYLF